MLMIVAVAARNGLSIVLLRPRRLHPRLHQAHLEGVLLVAHSLVEALRAVVVGAGRDSIGFTTLSLGTTMDAHFSARTQ